MPTILIAHRSDDTEAASGRLLDGLVRRLTEATVVTNVEAVARRPDRAHALRELFADTRVIVVVIGRSWLSVRDAQHSRPLDTPGDVIRQIIEEAVAARIPLIPVLVQDALPPAAAELPPTLKRFAALETVRLRHIRWADDLARLIDRIEAVLADATTSPSLDVHENKSSSLRRLRGLPRRLAARAEQFRRRVVRRSGHWRVIKRSAFAVIVVAGALMVYQVYRYIAAADLRRIQRLSRQLTYDVPKQEASARLHEIREIATGSKDAAVTETAVLTLKKLVADPSKTSLDARALRREAIDALKALRRKDLSQTFASEELKGADLFRADLSGTNLRRVSFESASMFGARFVDADLTGANLSGAYIRNADFTGANLSGADVGELDWYNAHGFTQVQLQRVVLSTLEGCPRDSTAAHSPSAFRAKLTKDYRASWDRFAEGDQRALTKMWEHYSKPGGLCDIVDRWTKPTGLLRLQAQPAAVVRTTAIPVDNIGRRALRIPPFILERFRGAPLVCLSRDFAGVRRLMP